MLTPPPSGASRADALGWLCLVPTARRPVRRLPYTTAPPPRWLWCVLSMRRLRCYGRLEEWYAKQAAALQVALHTAQVRQVEGRRGQILLSVSAPNVYAGVANEDLPPTNYVFEAASLAELQRWSFALHATPLAHRLMATASERGGSVYTARSEAGSVISSVDHNQAASPLARSTSWDRLTGGRLGGRSRVEPGAARVSEEVVVTNPCVRTVLGPMARARVS